MVTRSVSTLQELYDAVDAAKSGDVIEMAGGHYGDVWLYNKTFSSEVVIKSADLKDPAVFRIREISGTGKCDHRRGDG